MGERRLSLTVGTKMPKCNQIWGFTSLAHEVLHFAFLSVQLAKFDMSYQRNIYFSSYVSDHKQPIAGLCRLCGGSEREHGEAPHSVKTK